MADKKTDTTKENDVLPSYLDPEAAKKIQETTEMVDGSYTIKGGRNVKVNVDADTHPQNKHKEPENTPDVKVTEIKETKEPHPDSPDSTVTKYTPVQVFKRPESYVKATQKPVTEPEGHQPGK